LELNSATKTATEEGQKRVKTILPTRRERGPERLPSINKPRADKILDWQKGALK
jgi:hypothetical protein